MSLQSACEVSLTLPLQPGHSDPLSDGETEDAPPPPKKVKKSRGIKHLRVERQQILNVAFGYFKMHISTNNPWPTIKSDPVTASHNTDENDECRVMEITAWDSACAKLGCSFDPMNEELAAVSTITLFKLRIWLIWPIDSSSPCPI